VGGGPPGAGGGPGGGGGDGEGGEEAEEAKAEAEPAAEVAAGAGEGGSDGSGGSGGGGGCVPGGGSAEGNAAGAADAQAAKVDATVEELRQVLAENYGDVLRIFDYFAAVGGGSCFSLGLNQYQALCAQLKILGGAEEQARASTIFIVCNNKLDPAAAAQLEASLAAAAAEAQAWASGGRPPAANALKLRMQGALAAHRARNPEKVRHSNYTITHHTLNHPTRCCCGSSSPRRCCASRWASTPCMLPRTLWSGGSRARPTCCRGPRCVTTACGGGSGCTHGRRTTCSPASWAY
jgi:hypothetical protein